MKTIKTIFLTDVKNLAKNFFALVIAIGVCFLPALYAWFNIFSNWDPYGNTGSLQLAAICLDKGYTDEDGNYKNVGEDIIQDMAKSDKVDWVFVDSKEEAVDGVKAGKYYASVVIDEDFTYNMYNMFVATEKEPTLVFYQNQKKNPVATKISDTVVSTLQKNINEEFIKVMATTIFSDANDIQAEIESKGGVDTFIDKLESLNEDLITYEELIDDIIVGNALLTKSLTDSTTDVNYLSNQTEASAGSLIEAETSIEESVLTLDEYVDQVDTTVNTMESLLDSISVTLKEARISGDMETMVNACQATVDDTNHLVTDIEALSESLAKTAATDAATQETLNQLLRNVKDIQTIINALPGASMSNNPATEVKKTEEDIASDIDRAIANIESTRLLIDKQLIPQLENCIKGLELVIKNTSELMNDMSGILSNMGNVFGAMQTTIASTDTSLEKTKEALVKISDRLTTAIEKAKAVTEDERLEILVNTLTGDPELYGQFFSEPVEINTIAVYPVENYGSAVAPFYTTLSIWVGVIILAAIILVKPRKDKYPDAKPSEMFFGRLMFFLVMGQIQTVITVLGNIYLLKIQCMHPFLFWFTAAMASLSFTTLIYALVYTFGDVGKAIAVVVLVLQIAGSSGTYPIELLPEFFQKVYIFFPFPYAINAMRECICGLYQKDLIIYLLELSIFLIPALVIGLWLRIPFESINHFMEERMEDTEMM